VGREGDKTLDLDLRFLKENRRLRPNTNKDLTRSIDKPTNLTCMTTAE